jgi:hypothetical protein
MLMSPDHRPDVPIGRLEEDEQPPNVQMEESRAEDDEVDGSDYDLARFLPYFNKYLNLIFE